MGKHDILTKMHSTSLLSSMTSDTEIKTEEIPLITVENHQFSDGIKSKESLEVSSTSSSIKTEEVIETQSVKIEDIKPSKQSVDEVKLIKSTPSRTKNIRRIVPRKIVHQNKVMYRQF